MRRFIGLVGFLITFLLGIVVGGLFLPMIAPEYAFSFLRKEIDAQLNSVEGRFKNFVESLKKSSWLFEGDSQEIRLFKPDAENDIYELATFEVDRTIELTQKSKRLYFLNTKLTMREQCKIKMGFNLVKQPITLALSPDKSAVIITLPPPEILSCTRVNFSIPNESTIPISKEDREAAEKALREALLEETLKDTALMEKARESFRKQFLALPEMQLLIQSDIPVIFRYEEQPQESKDHSDFLKRM